MSSGLRGTDATQDSVSLQYLTKGVELTNPAVQRQRSSFYQIYEIPKMLRHEGTHRPSRSLAGLINQVDLRKVNIGVLRPWIARKVTEMIKFEDDVVVEYVFGMLEDRDSPVSSKAPSDFTELTCRRPILGKCKSTYLDSWINTELPISRKLCGIY
jgi:hypothetical protein